MRASARVEASGFIWLISGQTAAAAPTAPTAPVATKMKVPPVGLRSCMLPSGLRRQGCVSPYDRPQTRRQRRPRTPGANQQPSALKRPVDLAFFLHCPRTCPAWPAVTCGSMRHYTQLPCFAAAHRRLRTGFECPSDLALYQPDIAAEYRHADPARRLPRRARSTSSTPPASRSRDQGAERGGLDYLDHAAVRRARRAAPTSTTGGASSGRRLVLLTTKAQRIGLCVPTSCADDILMVGRESAGVPDAVAAARRPAGAHPDARQLALDQCGAGRDPRPGRGNAADRRISRDGACHDPRPPTSRTRKPTAAAWFRAAARPHLRRVRGASRARSQGPHARPRARRLRSRDLGPCAINRRRRRRRRDGDAAWPGVREGRRPHLDRPRRSSRRSSPSRCRAPRKAPRSGPRAFR